MDEVQREQGLGNGVLANVITAGIAAAQHVGEGVGPDDFFYDVVHDVVHLASKSWGPFVLVHAISSTCAQALVCLAGGGEIDASLCTFRLDSGTWTYRLSEKLDPDAVRDVDRAARLIAVYTNLLIEMSADVLMTGVLHVGPGAQSDSEAWKEHFAAIPADEVCPVASTAFLIAGQLVSAFNARIGLIINRSGS